jgi:hypothetical protein
MIAAYDGVWANFSLLHAPSADLPRILSAIATSLRDGGVFHIAMKTGTGETRDEINRLYSYVTLPELRGLLESAGFDLLSTVEGHEVGCAGTNDPYVAMLGRKHA